MHLRFETKALDTALSGIAKIVTSPQFIQFEAHDNKIRVMTTHDGFSVASELPGQLIKSGDKFAVVYEDLKKLFRNRKEIEMKVSDKGNKVMFKAGSSKEFSGDIVTVETHNIKFKGGDEFISLDKNQSAFLFGAMANLALDDFYFKKALPLTVHFTEKSGYCFVNSDYHVAIAKAKGKFKPLTVTLPYKNFTAIMNIAGKDAFDIAVTDANIVAHAKEFDAVLPIESQEENRTDEVLKVASTIMKEEPIAKVQMEELKASVDSILAIHDGKAAMNVSIAKNGITLSVSSLRGNVQDVMKAKTKGEAKFQVAPVMVSNILKNAKKGEFLLRTNEKMFCLSGGNDKVELHYIGVFHE